MKAYGGPPSPAPGVGNDVVDLSHPRCRGKTEDGRFLRRILAPEERAALEGAAAPHRTLWLLWAAKEAAYKALVQASPDDPPVFRHAAFVVEPGDPLPGCPGGCRCVRERTTRVRHGERRLAVRATVGHEAVHAVARADAGDGPGSERPVETGLARIGDEGAGKEGGPRDRVLPGEGEDASARASELVRLRAREAVARRLGVEPRRLEIDSAPGVGGRRGPPSVLLDGSPAPVKLSLSHHGRFVAWAFLVGDRG